MLIFEVEFLTRTSVAATPYHREETEWPPHPDRFFQALVASWGRNDPPDNTERSALEWVERLDMNNLDILAPSVWKRHVVPVFVPPNDMETKGKTGDAIPKKISEMIRTVPEYRKNRQLRCFPATTLPMFERSEVQYCWRLDEQEKQEYSKYRPALSRLAREVVYLGHSHSLVRVFLREEINQDIGCQWMKHSPVTMRVPYAGRLGELENIYRRSLEEGHMVRPNPSVVLRRFSQPDISVAHTYFNPENITILADTGGFAPLLPAFPLVAKRLRDALMTFVPKGKSVPALLSGHESDGRPTAIPHLSIIPLADVGWLFSAGRLMGIGLVWPRDAMPADRFTTLESIARFLQQKADGGGLLHFGRAGTWRIMLEPEPRQASLQASRYTQSAVRWGTVLPIVLDRYPKNKDGKDIHDIILRSCLNIDLPEDVLDGVDVELHKYSPIKGAPSVKEVVSLFPKDSPYRGKLFAHLAINFPKPVHGPIILGSGRFRGLGLCLPLDGGRP